MIKYPWLEPAWAVLKGRIESDRIAHAMLIHGPEGTGKKDLALVLLARLVCTQPGEFACDECRSCKLFKSGAHPDWFLLEPEEGKHQIVIDRVRSTISALTLTSSFSPRKVALIYPAEAMNKSSANALLKCLEEPPGETVMILVSHDASRLPVTVRSRCQSLVVALPEAEEAKEWLVTSGGLDPANADEALAAGAGSPLRAVQLSQAGQVELHRRLLHQLSLLLGRPGMVSRVASELSDIEDNALWSWLSNGCADLLKAALAGRKPEWMDQIQANIDWKSLSALQQRADRNRLLGQTPVRQDLLLQDWLINWSKLAVQPVAT
jgi:DNA polymerase-3 subunit delta'